MARSILVTPPWKYNLPTEVITATEAISLATLLVDESADSQNLGDEIFWVSKGIWADNQKDMLLVASHLKIWNYTLIFNIFFFLKDIWLFLSSADIISVLIFCNNDFLHVIMSIFNTNSCKFKCSIKVICILKFDRYL